jgi:TolB-like protein
MKRLVLITLGLLSFGGTSNADVMPASGKKKVVAVLPFSSPHHYSLMGRNAQSTFVTKLVNTRKVRVIQASMVLRMLRRYGLRWTGVISPRLLRESRRRLKADYILAGKLRYTGGAYTLSVHVQNVRTLETTHAQDVDFRNTRRMRVAVRIAAKKIAAVISGRGSGSSKAGLFLNVSARAFYSTADACIRSMKWYLKRFSFAGTVAEVDDDKKKVKVKGYGLRRLKKGVPLDIFSTDGIDGKQKAVTIYVTKVRSNVAEGIYRMEPDDGVPMSGKVSNKKHQWVVAVGKIVDEAADNEKLVKKFRQTLLQKMSEGTDFQQIEGRYTDHLAKLSNRRKRFFAYRKLFKRGVELVLEGKFYGSSGRRRAHFKFYSTLTGKLFGELKFETSL